MPGTRANAGPVSRPHFSETIRQRACECLNTVLRDDPGLKDRIRRGTWNLRPGGGDCRPAAEAWELFRHEHFALQADRARAQSMTIKQFYAILRRWATGWFSGSNKLCRHYRVLPRRLTVTEMRELCFHLGTPAFLDGTWHYWRDIDDALDKHPANERIAELVAKSALSHRVLSRRLLKCGGDLGYGVADQRDAMPDSTRVARKECARIWRGDDPWLYTSGESLAMKWSTDVPRESEALRYIFWKRPWNVLRFFTFQFDAFKFSDARGQRSAKTRAFHSLSRIFPPEEVRPQKSDSSAHELMWYLAACHQLGVVLGPEPCYHGSTPTLSPAELKANMESDPDGPEKHRADFPHWCASLIAFV